MIHLARALTNLGICGAVAFVVWWTQTPWAILGLLFLSYHGGNDE